jgi:hypothetical protein
MKLGQTPSKLGHYPRPVLAYLRSEIGKRPVPHRQKEHIANREQIVYKAPSPDRFIVGLPNPS